MDDRHGKQAGIEPVEPAAVTGKGGAGVLDAGAAFEGRLGEVADLSSGVAGDGDKSGGGQRHFRKQPPKIEDAIESGGDGTGDGAFPAFSGADGGGKFVFPERTSDVEGGRVADPVNGQREKQPILAYAMKREGGAPGPKSVKNAEYEKRGGRDGVTDALCAERECEGRQNDRHQQQIFIALDEEKSEAGNPPGKGGEPCAIVSGNTGELHPAKAGENTDYGGESGVGGEENNPGDDGNEDGRGDNPLHLAGTASTSVGESTAPRPPKRRSRF